MNTNNVLTLDNTEIRRIGSEWKPGQKRAKTIRAVFVWSEGRYQDVTVTEVP